MPDDRGLSDFIQGGLRGVQGALSAVYSKVGWMVPRASPESMEKEVSIVGIDEVDLDKNHISWISPLGRALMKSAEGDRVVLLAPKKTEHLEILEVRYERIPVDAFKEPPGAESAPKA